jgi:glycerol uptake facilitator protein
MGNVIFSGGVAGRDLGPRLAHAGLPIAGQGRSDSGYAWIPIIGPLISGVPGAVFFEFRW